MSNNTQQNPSQIRNEMDQKLTDGRIVLEAIEALFANSAIDTAGVQGRSINVHGLILIALDKTREAETLSSSLEVALRKSATQHNNAGL